MKTKIVVKRKASAVTLRPGSSSIVQSQVWAPQPSADQTLYDSMEALEESGLYKRPQMKRRPSYEPDEPDECREVQPKEIITSVVLRSNKFFPDIDPQLFSHCHLPAPLEDNILDRLPLSSLMTCRAVSRAWESKLSTLSVPLDNHTLAFTLFPRHRCKRHQLMLRNGPGSTLRLALWSDPGTEPQNQSQRMRLSLLPPGNSCSCPQGYTLGCANGDVFVFRSCESFLVGSPVTGCYSRVESKFMPWWDVWEKRVGLLLRSREPLVFKLACLEFLDKKIQVQIYDSVTGKWNLVLSTTADVRACAWDTTGAAWYWLVSDNGEWRLHAYHVSKYRSSVWSVVGLALHQGSRQVRGLVLCATRVLVVCREMRGNEFVVQVWELKRCGESEVEVEMVLESEVVSGEQHGEMELLRCCSDGVDRVWVLLPLWSSLSDVLLGYRLSSRQWRRYELQGLGFGDGDVAGIEGITFTNNEC